MNIAKSMIVTSVLFLLAVSASQAVQAQGLPMQDSMGGGLYGLSPQTRRQSTNTQRQPVRVQLTPYRSKPRVTHQSRQNANQTRWSNFNQPRYQNYTRQPQKSWKLVWSTTAYRDQANGMIQRLRAQGYHVTFRERTIPYQGYRKVSVVDIYCYLYQ